MADLDAGPLSPEQIDDLLLKIKECDKAIMRAEEAGRAGIDMSDQIRQLKDLKVSMMKIKNVYAPTRSL